ncbi:MAG TPA: copper chaperone PCu(A)C [Gemmatimonadaceae bacterium]|nr:copper chaperone PCu(A)C [Gemmatimonadaceae bacterium]
MPLRSPIPTRSRRQRPGPAILCLCLAACSGGDRDAVTAGQLTISGAVAPAPAGPAPMALYFTVANHGVEADTLLGVTSEAAAEVGLHRPTAGDPMAHVQALAVPARGELRLAPGGMHVMLDALRRDFRPGDSLHVVLRFRRAGAVPVAAPVVSYAELERYVAPQD